MIGVQLIGKDAVLSAFNKLGYDFWGLYEGKTPKVFGEGSDALADWLELFCTSGSTATYTLRIYDTDTLPTSQNGGLDFIASLNFKLIDIYEGAGIHGFNGKLMQRIEGLEKKLSGDGEDDGDDDDINTIIMGWLKNPEKLGMVVGAFKTLVGGASAPGVVSAAPVAAISGFENNTGSAGTTSDDDAKLQRLAVALDKLEKKDPKLIEHLEKLAGLDPLFFSAVIAKLDAL